MKMHIIFTLLGLGFFGFMYGAVANQKFEEGSFFIITKKKTTLIYRQTLLGKDVVMTDPIQELILAEGSRVKGNVIFKGESGIVKLWDKSTIEGTVVNGSIIDMKSNPVISPQPDNAEVFTLEDFTDNRTIVHLGSSQAQPMLNRQGKVIMKVYNVETTNSNNSGCCNCVVQ